MGGRVKEGSELSLGAPGHGALDRRGGRLLLIEDAEWDWMMMGASYPSGGPSWIVSTELEHSAEDDGAWERMGATIC